MKKYNREELDKRLARLRESRMSDESYFITRPEFAMCYSISMPTSMSITRKCDICGKSVYIIYSSHQRSVKDYEKSLARVAACGIDARIVCHCPDCIRAHRVKEYEIKMKAEDEAEYRISYPEELMNSISLSEYDTLSLFEISLIEKFLSVPEDEGELGEFFDRVYNREFRAEEASFFEDREPIDFLSVKGLTVPMALSMIKKHTGYNEDHHRVYSRGDDTSYIYNRFTSFFARRYSRLSYKGINGEERVFDYENAGFIKTQIDMALAKGLGLVAVYEKDEVIRNIGLIYSQDENHLKNKPAVLERLEKEWREPFTVFDYCIFMDSCKEALECE